MPSPQEHPLTSRPLLKILLRRGWVVVLAIVVCAGAALGYEGHRKVEYQSTVTLQPASSSSSTALPLVPTNPVLLASAASFLRVSSTEAAGMAGSIGISQGATSNLIYVSAVSEDPAAAQREATAFAEGYVDALRQQTADSLATLQDQAKALIKRISDLTRQGGGSGSGSGSAPTLVGEELTAAEQSYGTVQSQILALETAPPPATVYSQASAPARTGTGKTKVVGLAALVGLLAGLGLVLAGERLDRRVRTAGELASEVPIVVDLAVSPGRETSGLAVLEAPASLYADGVRELRTALQSVMGERPCSVILVTSAQPGDGSSLLAANLAAAWALAGRRVVAVSTDLRRPELDPLLGVEKSALGLSTLISAPAAELVPVGEPGGQWVAEGGSELALGSSPRPPHRGEEVGGVLVETPVPGLFLLPAGPAVALDPGDLLASAQMQEVLVGLRGAFDFVVVDTPAMSVASDAGALAGLADGVLVVGRAGKTNRKVLHQTLGRLRIAGARIVGVVVAVTRAPAGRRPAATGE